MEYRKLISFGKNSFVVSLPKSWINQNHLKKGDLLYLTENEGNLILNTKVQENKEERSINIDVDGKAIKQVRREIISAYINNNTTITLKGKEIKDKAKELQNIIQNLVALEVMEQTSKEIVAKDFLNIGSVSIDTVVRKIDIIIRSMFEDCYKMFEEDTYDNINFRDKDVNKLSFLMFRIVRYGMENHSFMLKKFNLKPVDLLILWWMTFELESIADEVKRVARYMQLISLSKKKQEQFLQILKPIKDNYLHMMKAYYSHNINAVHSIINQREDQLIACEQFYLDNKQTQYIAFLVNRTKALLVMINHLGRVVYQ